MQEKTAHELKNELKIKREELYRLIESRKLIDQLYNQIDDAISGNQKRRAELRSQLKLLTSEG